MKTQFITGSDPQILCVEREPKTARHFDFEGTNAALSELCYGDRSETGCEAHAAFWNGPQHWTLWRLDDRARFIREAAAESGQLITPLWLD